VWTTSWARVLGLLGEMERDGRITAEMRSPATGSTTCSYRPRSTGEIYRVRYNPTHRWFYVPEMRVDDGDPDKMLRFGPGKARFTAHSTFEDPAAPVDVLPRESIELRTLVFHVS